MIDRLRKLIPWVGYPAFALFAFLTFLYLTFPLERLKPRIERQASQELGMEVTVGELSPRPLAGVSLEGVNLVSRPAPGAPPVQNPDGSTSPAKPMRLHLDQVVVKVGLLPFLWSALDLSFYVQGLGGEIEGSYRQKPAKTAAPPQAVPGAIGSRAPKIMDWSAEAELQKVNLAALQVIRDAIGLPITGQLSGKADLAVPAGRWSEAGGNLELDLEDCSIGDGKAKLKVPGNPMLALGITLPRLRVGRIRGTIAIEKGIATLRLASQDKVGEVDVEVDIEGRLSLRNPLPFSSIDAYAKFRVNPDLKKRDAKFELLENGLASAKRGDGSYGVQLGGMLKQLQPRLSPVGGSTGGGLGGAGGGIPRGRYR